jgi:dTDP-4-dehydrorhamnose 3,5-epimerase
VLEDNSELLYLHTAFYDSGSEDGIRYNDPRINIEWPLKPVDLSERDQQHPLISKDFNGYKT